MMVAETKDGMKQMFDTLADGFRTGIDAGRKTQEAWVETMDDARKSFRGFDVFFAYPDRFTKDWMPLMTKNTRAMVDCFDANVKAGMNVVKTACENTLNPEEGDFYTKNRNLWDATFEAARTNFDTFGKASKAAMDNWTAFCQSTCGEAAMPKPTPKQSR